MLVLKGSGFFRAAATPFSSFIDSRTHLLFEYRRPRGRRSRAMIAARV
jgi:hypothetical protein